MQEAVSSLLERLQPPKGVIAVGIVDGSGEVHTFCPDGIESKLFEFGSVTKTLTATLLATLVIEGRVSLDTDVGSVIGHLAGNAANVRLHELATHTSGLPRLPPNLLRVPFWPRDPYRFYDESQLLKGLIEVELRRRGTFEYSNLGYMLLGYCLSKVERKPFATALSARVLGPAGMRTARCQPHSRKNLLRGSGPLLIGGRRWHQPLPGHGGVDGAISDLAQWARTNVQPGATALESAIRLAQSVHASDGERGIGLGWHFSESILWHNGATGSFQSVVAIRPGQSAVCGLASIGHSKIYQLDVTVMEWFRAIN